MRRLLAFTLIATTFTSAMADAPPLKPLSPEQYADDAASERTRAELEKQWPEENRPEAVKMLIAILGGSQMGPNDGWFGPAQSRYGWKWLAERCELADDTELMPRDKFTGSDAAWKALDRDGDGNITPSDLDWSPDNRWVEQAYLVSRFFRRINVRGDGKLTRDDLLAFFDRHRSGKDHLTVGDLREGLLSMTFLPGDSPTREQLVRGLFSGEVGSMHEGPALGDAAPNFTLKTADGARTVELASLTGKKPVVLVLGNFTCGPFRAFYPEVDAVHQRFGDQAEFLMVYVREAHPADGWKMESNTRASVDVKQPTTLVERAAVCDQFCQKLQPTLPVVVDDVTDAVGNAYSGMPARLYVIDREGKVAFKSGRGPFGFKVGEMEQALAMALIEH